MSSDFSHVLRNAGLRVTDARLATLTFFAKQKRPIGLQRVADHLSDVNLTTVYRLLETFLEAGILRACDVGHGHVDYELADLPHHHHVICTSCGRIEDVADCSDDDLLHKRTAQASQFFKKIIDHQATFYGVCVSCT